MTPPVPDLVFLRPANDSTSAANASSTGVTFARTVAPATSRSVSLEAMIDAAGDAETSGTSQQTKRVPDPHSNFSKTGPAEIPAHQAAAYSATPSTPLPESQSLHQDELDRALRQKPKNKTKHKASEAIVAATPRLSPAWRVAAFEWPQITDRIISKNSTLFAKWALQQQPCGVSLVLGARSNCGVSSIAMVVTRILAESQRLQNATTIPNSPQAAIDRSPAPILLIEANLTRPSLANRLGLYLRQCWAEQGLHGSRESKIANQENSIQVMPLSCAVAQREALIHPGGNHGDWKFDASKISYLLPESAVPSITQRLGTLIQNSRSLYQHIVVDLGALSFWDQRQQLTSIAQHADNAILVEQAPVDRRVLSECFWRLSDCQLNEVTIIENRAK